MEISIGEHIVLRPLIPDHGSELFAAIDESRDRLKTWLPWVKHSVSLADNIDFIARARQQEEQGTGLHRGIWCRGELAGVIGFNVIDKANRYVVAGYWLADRYEGFGICSAACRAMINYAFDELEMNRATIYCAADNERSRALAERLGFTAEGRLRQVEWLGDRFCDHVIYGMLAAEWKEQRKR